MTLVRRVAADEKYEGQDIYRCANCEVEFTRAAFKDGGGEVP